MASLIRTRLFLTSAKGTDARRQTAVPALLCVLACIVFGSMHILAQSAPSSSQSGAVKSAGSDLTVTANAQRACSCPDRRRFAIGASMFGKNSARVLITGFHSEPSAGAGPENLPRCSDLLVLGQVVELAQAPDGRPFLKRDNLKRGSISRICDTQISFIEPKKSYDFFADDGSALTLTEDAAPQPVDPAQPVENTEQSDDLAGQDLLRLLPAKTAVSDPGNTQFDEQDLKEGAYVILRKRSKAAVAESDDNSAASVAQNRLREVTVPAGTLGIIRKRAGFRSEALWIVEILPDSAPRPFWRSLLRITRSFIGQPAVAGQVVLSSSHIVEINHFFDQYRVDWTYFGDDTGNVANKPDPGTTRLPAIYSPVPLSLEENVAEAQKFRLAEAIEKATVGIRLVARNRAVLARRTMLVLDEAVPSGAETAPDLLHRQCFVGLDRLKDSQSKGEDPTRPQALRITKADVKIFQPKDDGQVPTDFYAIDLQFTLQPDFGASKIPLVCRFPLASIDLGLVDSAARILSSKFEVGTRNRGEP